MHPRLILRGMTGRRHHAPRGSAPLPPAGRPECVGQSRFRNCWGQRGCLRSSRRAEVPSRYDSLLGIWFYFSFLTVLQVSIQPRSGFETAVSVPFSIKKSVQKERAKKKKQTTTNRDDVFSILNFALFDWINKQTKLKKIFYNSSKTMKPLVFLPHET